MPVREITVMVTFSEEPTEDLILQVGRDAACRILASHGTRAPYGDSRTVESVRFRHFEWLTVSSDVGYGRQYAVTDEERAVYDEDGLEF